MPIDDRSNDLTTEVTVEPNVLVGLASETIGVANVNVDDNSIDDDDEDDISEEGDDEESSNATSEDEGRDEIDEMEVWVNELQEGGDLVTPVAELSLYHSSDIRFRRTPEAMTKALFAGQPLCNGY